MCTGSIYIRGIKGTDGNFDQFKFILEIRILFSKKKGPKPFNELLEVFEINELSIS